jgi:hypothetical protein
MPSTDSVVGAAGSGLARYWPTILAALRAEGIDSERVEIAAAATLAAEVGPSFMPVTEGYPRGVDPIAYFESKYGSQTSVGKRLGNTEVGDGYRFRGRGFIQLTGRDNYQTYGSRIGVDLLSDPDAATNTYNAARILAVYFKDRGVGVAADAGDWPNVRRLVNGGLNGWTTFKAVIDQLLPSVSVSPPPNGGDSTTTPKATAAIAVLIGGFLLALLRRFR